MADIIIKIRILEGLPNLQHEIYYDLDIQTHTQQHNLDQARATERTHTHTWMSTAEW